MDAKNAICSRYSSCPTEKIGYEIQVGSKKIFRQLKKSGFTPNKSLRLRFPAVPRKMLSPFIRGFFDGDGCVFHGFYKPKDRRRSRISVLRTSFTSDSKPFLASIKQCLVKEAGLKSGSLFTRSATHHVRSYNSSNDSRQLYNFLYPTSTVPCLTRKRTKFKNGIKNHFGPVV